MRRDTQITLYKTGRIDATYQNIWAFADENERQAFLLAKSPYPFLRCKYWRPGQAIKLQVPFDRAYEYDYVRVVNNDSDASKRKTYYCFITNRAYINDNVTMFYLDIDIVQTWYFSAALDGGVYPFWQTSAFVAKTTDNSLPPRGTPSDFPSVETTCVAFNYAQLGYSVVIYSSIDIRDLSEINYTSAIIDGQFTAAPPYVMVASATTIANLINALNTKGLTDAVSGIYLIPNDYINISMLSTTPRLATDDALYLTRDITVNQPTSCDGYIPKNKVLLGYDYSYFTINNGQGEVIQYNFEDFNGTPSFSSRLSLASGSPVILLYPNNYNDRSASEFRQRAQKITTAPSCTYLNDNYKIWLAQTQNSRAAAINQSAEAINQAQYARSQSFAYNFGGEIKNLEDTTRPVISSTLYKISNIMDMFTGKKSNRAIGAFGGGSSRGSGGGATFGYAADGNAPVVYSGHDPVGTSGHFANDAMALYDLGIAYLNKQLGIETAYQYDFAVKNAQLAQNALLAGYRDKASVPAQAVGSNAYGDMCVLEQYGFMIATYTPTREYAEWIDKTLTAGGHTVNKYGVITKHHTIFDYYQAISVDIPADAIVRPDFARAHLIAILTNGVYLWYYNNRDISANIGTPYNLDNPEVV